MFPLSNKVLCITTVFVVFYMKCCVSAPVCCLLDRFSFRESCGIHYTTKTILNKWLRNAIPPAG